MAGDTNNRKEEKVMNMSGKNILPRYAQNSPCKPDCEERSPECHATCKKWAKYEVKRNEEYKKVKEWKEQNNPFHYISKPHSEKIMKNYYDRKSGKKRK